MTLNIKVRHLAAACIALAAGQACAQSSVRFYGLVDMWAGRSQTAGGGAATTVINSGGMQTSYWGLGGSEALDGSSRAVFAIEGYLQADSGMAGRTPGDALFARNAYVGLQGAAGEVRLGRLLNPLFVASAQSNPFGGSIRFAPLLAQLWSASMGRTVAGDTSWDNAASYTTPDLHGMKLAVYTGLGEGTAASSPRNIGATLSYVRGPLATFLIVQRVGVGPGLAVAGRTRQNTYFAGGSYGLGRVRLFASLDSANSRNPGLDARTAQAGMSTPAGGGNVLLSWARTDNETNAGLDSRRDTGALGYDYFLSRRTDLYAVLQSDRLSTANRAHSVGLGLRHTF